jgi:hypothetical protein
LYLSLLDWVPDIRQRLTAPEQWRLFFFGKLRAWSRENIKWPVRIPVERLWLGRSVAPEATPAGLVVLKRTPSPDPKLSVLQPDEVLLDELIGMNFGEARHFLALIKKNRSVNDYQSWQAAWRKLERQLLKFRLAEMPVYLLELPRTYSSSSEFRKSLTDRLMHLVGSG